MTSRILAVTGESLSSRTIRSGGFPKQIHEREVTYKLECGHTATRRYRINRGTTKVRTKLRCEVCAAGEETAA